jgi:CRISPR type III-A-associated protein Csm2
MVYDNKEREHRNFREHKDEGRNNNQMQSKKVSDEIRKYLQGDEMNWESQYKLFSLEGSIKKDYCQRQGDEAKMNQLRKFYDQILSIQEGSSRGNKDIGEKLNRIVPVARYAKARELIDDGLMNLINEGVGIICKQSEPEKKKKSIDRFKNVMEAIIAYSKKEKSGGH